MGWTGTYIDECPKGKDRALMAIRQEGYEYVENDRRSHVIDYAMRGSTVYLAVKFDNGSSNEHVVYGAVITTYYEKNRGEFITKGMSDSMIPGYYDCPKRILDKLTPTDSDNANEWRRICRQKMEEKQHDELRKLPFGTKLQINEMEGVWSLAKVKNRKSAVNYVTMRCRHRDRPSELRKCLGTESSSGRRRCPLQLFSDYFQE